MTPVELPLAPTPIPPRDSLATPAPSAVWLKTARRARLLSWASLAWMTVEGVVGLCAGLNAHALSVIIWAASSFVEGLASVIVIWRFSGNRTTSPTSEHTAQRLVAGSFLLLVPFFLYEAVTHLITGGQPKATALGIAVTASAILLMPLLGTIKLRLASRLDSHATAGEGIQNLMCAAQALAALIALIGASAGLGILDPISAVIVTALAAKESVALWNGNADDCCAPAGFGNPAAPSCCQSADHGCC